MDAESNTDNLAEVLLRELRRTTPNFFLGFPPPEEMKRRREEIQRARMEWVERMEQERETKFQELKRAALANLRKDHP